MTYLGYCRQCRTLRQWQQHLPRCRMYLASILQFHFVLSYLDSTRSRLLHGTHHTANLQHTAGCCTAHATPPDNLCRKPARRQATCMSVWLYLFLLLLLVHVPPHAYPRQLRATCTGCPHQTRRCRTRTVLAVQPYCCAHGAAASSGCRWAAAPGSRCFSYAWPKYMHGQKACMAKILVSQYPAVRLVTCSAWCPHSACCPHAACVMPDAGWCHVLRSA